MKVYDGFAFFNEFELLDLRLEELYPVVDHFILVEATRTFQGQPKPLYYQENKERYKRFADKIIHIVVDTYPSFFKRFRKPTTWDYDNAQKEFILKGLKDAQPDDVVIVSDLDELPLAAKVLEYKNTPGVRVFEQYLSFYYLNNVCSYLNGESQKTHGIKNKNGFGFWRGPVMLERKYIKTIKKTRLMRDLPDSKVTVIHEGGWHFTYMGGVENIIKKIESWAHSEFNNSEYKNPDSILKSIYEGRSLFDPKTTFKVADLQGPLPFPPALLKNLQKYQQMILPP